MFIDFNLLKNVQMERHLKTDKLRHHLSFCSAGVKIS